MRVKHGTRDDGGNASGGGGAGSLAEGEEEEEEEATVSAEAAALRRMLPQSSAGLRGGVEHWSSSGGVGVVASEVEVCSDAVALDGYEVACVGVGRNGDNTTVSVCSTIDGALVRNFEGEHHERVCSVALGGGLLITASRDKTIRVWSRRTGECTAVLNGCDEVPIHLSLRGTMLLSGEIVCRKVARARLWSVGGADGNGTEDGDARAAGLLATFAEHSAPIWNVALGDGFALTASGDTSARVWPLDGRGRVPSTATLDHPNPVDSCSVDGELVATGCDDGKVHLWELRGFTCLCTLDHASAGAPGSDNPLLLSTRSAARGVFCVRLLGGWLVTAGRDSVVRLWNLAPTSDKRALAECVAELSHRASARGLAISPFGHVALCLMETSGRSTRRVRVWRPGVTNEDFTTDRLQA
jgi:WD40 repeat protein